VNNGNGTVGGNDDYGYVFVNGGKSQGGIETGPPGPVFSRDAFSVQNTGEAMKAHVYTDMNGAVYLGQ
jgi:hypothetical protein